VKIKNKSIDVLVGYSRNARTHSDEQVTQIANSIKEFGFNDPIAVDEGNVIIEGHGRVLAAKELGLKQVPVIELSHLSDIQKRAYILAHNTITENAGWDQELLAAEIGELQAANADDLIGIDINDLIGRNQTQDIFQPDLSPDITQHGKVVGNGDIEAMEEKLKNHFSEISQTDYVEVICPGCGEEFNIGK